MPKCDFLFAENAQLCFSSAGTIAFSNMKQTNKAVLLFIVIFACRVDMSAQDQPVRLTKEQAKEDFHWLQFALEYVHPRLYKYENKTIVDARFESLEKRIDGDVTGLDFLALVSAANATVRCGHLYTIPQGPLAKEISEKKVLPFHIKVGKEKMYFLYDCSDSSIPNGSQILSINGKSDRDILDAVLAGIAADGYIQTRKYRLMERYFFPLFHGFDLYYYLHADRSSTFKVDYVEYGSQKRKTAVLKGISTKERQKLLLDRYRVDEKVWFRQPVPQFRIQEQDGYAVLTVSRSFYDKKVDPDFDSLLQAAFFQIKEKSIKNLVLDLRNNEGGDERQQMELISYLYDRPFKLYEHIYLSRLDFRPLKSIIIERDTSELLFNNDDEYMRKINDHLWINNYEYSDNLMLKPPKENVFRGKLYVLMNGACFSSAADLIADLRKTTDAVFIGEETGGAYEGPTGGSTIAVQLPNSKIMVRISPNIQTGYMYQKHPVGRGVLPTHPVEYTIENVVERRDLEMEVAKQLILGKK